MTKRPEMNPENYEAVYDYYREPRGHTRLNTAVHMLGEALYSPDIVISDVTRHEILAQFMMGKSALVACNHPSSHDVLALPGALRATEIPGLQETGALAKDSLFRGPMRYVSDNTGSIPVFRSKSYPDLDRSVFVAAANAALDTAAERLIAGESIVVLPEGTNSRPEALTRLESGDIKAGIARIALKATDQHSFILPMGIHYTRPTDRKLPPRHPVVVFGRPITTYERTTGGVKAQVLRGMQTALNRANNYTGER